LPPLYKPLAYKAITDTICAELISCNIREIYNYFIFKCLIIL